MVTCSFYTCSFLLIYAVNVLTAQQCSIPTSLHGEWRIDNSSFYKVNEEKFQKVDNGGQVIVTYVCNTLFLSGRSSRIFDYIMLDKQDNPNNTFCVQYRVYGENLFIYAQANVGVRDTNGGHTVPTAQNSCQNKIYRTPYDIYVKTNRTEGCSYLQNAKEKYQASIITDVSMPRCERDRRSFVNIINSSMHMSTCAPGVSGFPLNGSVLSCAGVINNALHIGGNSSLAPKAMILQHENRYYCSRVSNQSYENIRMSIDLTDYDSGKLKCNVGLDIVVSTTVHSVGLRLIPYDCGIEPCDNDGVCHQNQTSFTCDCQNGFSGDYCEKDVCSSSPCQNYGTCVRTAAENFTCTCIQGVTGPRCENNPFGACVSSPCLNGGTCERRDRGFDCACTDSYFGDTCENTETSASDDVTGPLEQRNTNDSSLQWYWIVVIILSVVAAILLIVILVCLATCKNYEEKLEGYDEEIVTDNEVKQETPKTMAEPYMERSAKTGATGTSGYSSASTQTSGSKASSTSDINPVSANLLSADYASGATGATGVSGASGATDASAATDASNTTKQSGNRLSVNKRNSRLESRKSRKSSRHRHSSVDSGDSQDGASQGTENSAYYALLAEARLLSEIL